jgi:hypothetical protein
MMLLKDRVGLNDEHLKAIGLVAVHWAFIENILSSIIWNIANLRQARGIAITTHLSERSQQDICNALAHETFRGRLEEKELKDHLHYIFETLYPQRNKIVHATWGYSAISGASDILPIKARGKVTIGPRESLTPEAILKIAEEIEQAANDLDKIKFKIFQLLPTLTNWP